MICKNYDHVLLSLLLESSTHYLKHASLVLKSVSLEYSFIPQLIHSFFSELLDPRDNRPIKISQYPLLIIINLNQIWMSK